MMVMISFCFYKDYEGFKRAIAMDGSQFLNRRLRIQKVERETKSMLSRTAFHKSGGRANPDNNKDTKKKNSSTGGGDGRGGRPWEGQRVDANQARRQLKKRKVRQEIRKTKKKEKKNNVPKTHKKQKTQ